MSTQPTSSQGRPMRLSLRVQGFTLLIRSLLPIWLVLFLITFTYKSTSYQENKKIYNIMYHEVEVLEGRVLALQYQIDGLTKNYDKTVQQLLIVKAELELYIDNQEDKAKAFWAEMKKAAIEQGRDFEKFKKFVLKQLYSYLAIVKKVVLKIKNYIYELIDFKDQILKFAGDLKKAVEPLNSIIKAIDKIDVLGVFDAFTIDFPTLPSFPAFPVIDWSVLKPDLTPIIEEAKGMNAEAMKRLDSLKTTFDDLAQLPELSTEFVQVDTITERFIDPLVNMFDILVAYKGDLVQASSLINYELLERKAAMKPWAVVLGWSLVIWLVLAFIAYLYQLKYNLTSALRMLAGKEPGPHPNQQY